MLRPDESGKVTCTLCGKKLEEHTPPEIMKCFPERVIGTDKQGVILGGPVIDTTNIRHSKE
jgi:hypothetical protein